MAGDGRAPRLRPTKREFLQALGSTCGTSALLVAMDALGLGIESAHPAPPALSGRADGVSVLILGAGIAGMTLAYELSKYGYECRILEARGFAGGRCQTARAGFALTELGGEKQVCDFDDGLYFNHGAWRIPSHHRSTLHYCREFNIPLEVLINNDDRAWVMFENIDGPLRGKRLRRREVMADMRGYTSELLAKCARQGALESDLMPGDVERLTDYLVHEGFLDDRDLRYRGTEERGFRIEPGAGLDPGPGDPAPPLAFEALLRSGLGNLFRGVPSYERPYTMFQPIGGMDRIATAFAERLGPRITYNAEVQQIDQNEAGVSVAWRDTHTGETRRTAAEYCITTLPLAVLGRIPAALPSAYRTAVRAATGTPVGKIGLQMNRRFWEEDDGIFGGTSYTDIEGHRYMVYPSTGWLGKKGVLQGYYNFRGEAVKISALSNAARTDFALRHGEKVHPGRFRAEFAGSSFSVAWHRVRYSLGGWDLWSEEGLRDSYPVLVEPAGRVYFAGTYLSYLTGWQAGAIESAWQQAERLHRRVAKG